jgi:hypothetical protein
MPNGWSGGESVLRNAATKTPTIKQSLYMKHAATATNESYQIKRRVHKFSHDEKMTGI